MDIRTYPASIIRVVDGDTVDVIVDHGFDHYSKLRLRLIGINAPELSTEQGQQVKAWLTDRLPIGCSVTINTVKDRREKYGRYLATIIRNSVDVNAELLEKGFVVPYAIDRDAVYGMDD